MKLNEAALQTITECVVNATLKYLEENEYLVKPKLNERSAYQKTESLLYAYNGFKRILKEKQMEIDELRMYGVPETCGQIKEAVQGGIVQGIVLDEERVEAAVRSVQDSVQGILKAINLIDKCMVGLQNDPYYDILKMQYFDRYTQQDIALHFNCSQVTISKNKSRLVKELSMRLFPNQVIEDMLN